MSFHKTVCSTWAKEKERKIAGAKQQKTISSQTWKSITTKEYTEWRVADLERKLREKGIFFNNETLQKKFVEYSPHFNDEELTSIEKVASFRELHKLFNTLLLKYEKVATDDKKSDKRKGAAKGRRGDRGQ